MCVVPGSGAAVCSSMSPPNSQWQVHEECGMHVVSRLCVWCGVVSEDAAAQQSVGSSQPSFILLCFYIIFRAVLAQQPVTSHRCSLKVVDKRVRRRCASLGHTSLSFFSGNNQRRSLSLCACVWLPPNELRPAC